MINCKVSLIIPMYNVQNFISNLINNLKNQKMKQVEFLLVDDGSSDNTFSEVKMQIEKLNDNRFRLLHHQNAGVSGARNYGIKLAVGDYIMFADADDEFDSLFVYDYYTSIVESGSDIAFFPLQKKYGNGSKFIIDYSILSNKSPINVSEFIKYFSISKIWGYPPTFISKRLLWKKSCFDISISYQEDNLALFQLLLNKLNISISFFNKCHYNYIQNDGSAVHNLSISSYQQATKVCNIISNNIRNSNLTERSYRLFLNQSAMAELNLIKKSIYEKKIYIYSKARKRYIMNYLKSIGPVMYKIKRLPWFLLVLFNLRKVIFLLDKFKNIR